MRQPDWRTWLLDDAQREAAQVMFLLHPEWEEWAGGSETGRLLLTIPSPTIDHSPLLLDCCPEAITVSWEGAAQAFSTKEPREAMRLAESILWEEAVSLGDWKDEKSLASVFCRLDSAMPPSHPDTTHRVIASWDGTHDQILRFL